MDQIWLDIGKIIAPILLGLLVWISTRKYNKTQIDLAKDKMEKDLFTEFNARYDLLNEYLEEITKFGSLKELSSSKVKSKYSPKELRYKLNDYFNLCAEEYYWYSKNRISERIWMSWHTGMNSWYKKHPIIREAWDEEVEKYGAKSFYLDNGNEFFTI